MNNPYHAANRHRWNLGASSWARRTDQQGIWDKCHRDPSLALSSAELKWLRHISGKTVAVLGSGDNVVVFALAGLGAQVTSVDFSIQQIKIAQARAKALRLQVEFVQAD